MPTTVFILCAQSRARAKAPVVFPLLGLTVLQPIPSLSEVEYPVVFDCREVGTNARAIESDGEFVVLKGSTARKGGTPSWQSYKGLREELVEDGKLQPAANPEYLEFVEDIPFRSPSAASSVVAAGARSGNTAWRVAGTGQTYGEWQEERLKAAGVETSTDG